MHFDSGERGPALAALMRPRLLALVCCALAGCVSEPARESGTKPLAPPAPAAPETAPPSAQEEPAQALPVAEQQGASGPPVSRSEPESGAAPEPEQQPEQESVQGVEQEPKQEPTKGPEEEAPITPPTGAAPTTPADWLHGSLSLRYRGRASDDDEDHEARAVLALDVADPRAPWISGHVLARMDVDLEGLDGGEVFEDLSDTYDEAVVAKLYLFYADVALDRRPEESPGTLRIGRQSDARLPEVLRLDGVSYLTKPLGKRELELGVYGGIPVHLYESSPEGDLAFGTFAEGIPWEGGRARFDWMHLEDELLLGEERDDLLALALWQQLNRHWRLEGEFSHLEGDPRDLRLRALFDDADSETIVRVGYYELLETQKTRVTELDPFSEELLEYFPFRQATLNVSRAFGAHTVIDAGLDARRVNDADDVGEFNREWERYYATATLHDLFTPGLALSATADRWDDDDQDTSSLGADVSYAADEWTGAIGSYYSLYKYELLELDEREDVRTYYIRAGHELSAHLDLDLSYEFEDDDLETYHTLRLGVLWRF